MEQDKMREQFTAWLAKQEQEQLAMGNPRFTGTEIGCMGRAWEAAWQASREAVVVELPPCPQPELEGAEEEDMEAFYALSGLHHACRAAIEAAGIRTK